MGFNLFGKSKGNSTKNIDNRQDNSVHTTNTDTLSGNAMKAGGDINITDGGAFDLVGDVTKQSLNFAGDAVDAIEGTAEEAFGMVAHTTDSAFDLSNSVVNGMKESNERTAAQMSQAFASSLGTVERLAQSDDATTAQSMQKIGLVMVAGLVLSFFAMARK